jgi:hypothetical protein
MSEEQITPGHLASDGGNLPLQAGDNESAASLDDTQPVPVIQRAGLNWKLSIVAIVLGLLCAVGSILFVIKSVLDTFE